MKPLTGRKKNIAVALGGVLWLAAMPLGYLLARIIIHFRK